MPDSRYPAGPYPTTMIPRGAGRARSQIACSGPSGGPPDTTSRRMPSWGGHADPPAWPSLRFALVADLEPGEPADDDVLAGLRAELGAKLLDRLAVVLVGVDVLLVEQHDLLHPLAQLAFGDLRAHVLGLVGRLLLEDAQLGLLGLPGDLVLGDVLRGRQRGDVQRDVAGERDEVVVARDEVGVAVDLDEHADLAVGMDVGLDGALGGLAAGELRRAAEPLDPQPLDRLVDVAGRLGQGLLAIHHPRAGAVAQGLDV